MILKFFELNKINLKKNRLILLYGKNDGLKKESINIILKDYDEKSNYDEKEVLDHFDTFLEDISSRSLFEKEKIIVIKRATEKISRILDEIKTKNFDDIIIIETGTLDKILNFWGDTEHSWRAPDPVRVIGDLVDEGYRSGSTTIYPSSKEGLSEIQRYFRERNGKKGWTDIKGRGGRKGTAGKERAEGAKGKPRKEGSMVP